MKNKIKKTFSLCDFEKMTLFQFEQQKEPSDVTLVDIWQSPRSTAALS